MSAPEPHAPDASPCVQCGQALPAGFTGPSCPACLLLGAGATGEIDGELTVAMGVSEPGAAAPEEVIGPYRLVEPLGEGGFGTVWRAEQSEPIRREVALKLIKPGMGSREVLARFEAERRALALMEHPNIAAVLDAGTAGNGQPYFVMELVRGLPVTTYCDNNRLTLRQRLELFIPVCQAVQHAHQKAVLHRDLKPSNILVAEVDGQPLVKVIDFGVAKALGQDGEESWQGTLARTLDGMVVGTPQYMSPEQAGAATDIDTRSDVYTLGVILYELLCGETPLTRESLRQAAVDEMLRRIREEEAGRPSSRLSPIGEAVRARAETRQVAPERISRELRGDLDWITLRALEKERERRYGSAAALAADLQRHLDDEPVEAGPPSAWYQFGKFARRNRILVGASAAVALTLICGIAVSTWQSAIISNSRDREATLRKLAEDRETETKKTFARAEFNEASELLDTGRSSEALGHLARALRMDPTNQSALVRALNLLMDRNWPLPGAGGRVDPTQFPTGELPDIFEHRVTTAIGESYDAVFEFKARAAASYAGYFRYDFSAWDGNVFLFEQNLKSLCENEMSLDGFGGQPIPLAYSPDGRWVGIPGQASPILVDRSDGSRIKAARHEGRVACIAFSPDGRLIATGANDNYVKIWDIEHRELFMEPIDHQGWIRKIAFSSDGQSLAVESEEGIFLWNISDRRRLNFVLDKETDRDSGIEFEWSPAPKHPLVAWWANGFVSIIDYREGGERFRLLPDVDGTPAGEIQWVQFVESGASLLTFSGGKLQKRETKLGKLVQEIDSQKPWGIISPVGAYANSRILIPEDKDRSVLMVLDPATLEVKCRLHCSGSDRFKSAEFVQNGARVLTVSESGLVSLFDAFNGVENSALKSRVDVP